MSRSGPDPKKKKTLTGSVSGPASPTTSGPGGPGGPGGLGGGDPRIPFSRTIQGRVALFGVVAMGSLLLFDHFYMKNRKEGDDSGDGDGDGGAGE